MPHQHDDELRFRPTSGRGTGILAVLGALAVVVLALVNPGGTPLPLVFGAVLLGVLAWASILWPRLSIDGDELVLRNMLETVRVPLAAIEAVVVRQFLAVWADGKRYVSPTVGRSWRANVRNVPNARTMSGLPTASTMSGVDARDRINRPTLLPGEGAASSGINYVDYVEQEINHRVALAKGTMPGGLPQDEQGGSRDGVRRQPSWLPIGLIVASVLALLVSVLV